MSKIGKKSKIKNENKAASGSSRRDFLTKGAVAGVGGAAALAGAGATAAQAGDPHHGPTWDREVDVIVIGAGASGLSAANAARDEGVEVMLVEHHFDIGGIAIMSGGDIRIEPDHISMDVDRHKEISLVEFNAAWDDLMVGLELCP